ncbi:MAG: hypothetical protein WAU89_04240 [Candidatus Acidiferrales bacterium]
MPLNILSTPNKLGIASVFFYGLFRIYALSSFGPNTFMGGVYVQFGLVVGLLVGATIAAIIAAILGSKWWLLALMGPLMGVMLILGAST